jgi:transposase, IS5 family
MQRIRDRVKTVTLRVRNRTRSVARRVFEIVQRSRTVSPRHRRPAREKAQARMTELYRELLRIVRAVIGDADRVGARTSEETAPNLRRLRDHLRETVTAVRRILAQTRARVVQGNTHYPDKLLSLFEPHTEAIRKGKAAKPTEFGKLVKIQEAEAQFITDYEVCASRVPDGALWAPSLDRHRQLFGRPPRLAVADAGFALRGNEQLAREQGVQSVVLPRQRRERRGRRVRAALRWRTGSEGRISALKRCHGLARCRYRGLLGMERWVGLGVIANNLLALGRAGP